MFFDIVFTNFQQTALCYVEHGILGLMFIRKTYLTFLQISALMSL